MRLLRLELRAVGPFVDRALDLSAGDRGLHILYGANEAGKSSALRALGCLLYGFPHQSKEGFAVTNERLRVAAIAAGEDGQSLGFVRKKTKPGMNSLRDYDDENPLAEDQLAKMLGGTDRETFEMSFGLDRARLAQAGAEIRQGKGRLGEMLFAAGSGLGGLAKARAGLEQRVGSLYKPTGKQAINRTMLELTELRKRLVSVQLRLEVYDEHTKLLREAEVRASVLDDELMALLAARLRLDRVGAAIPVRRRVQDLECELLELDAAPRLSADFGDRCREAELKRRTARRTIADLEPAIADERARFDDDADFGVLLAAADAIEDLHRRVSAVEKAASDRVRLEHFRSDQEHRAREALAKLGQSKDLENASRWKLRADEDAAISEAIRRGEKIEGVRAAAEEAAETARREVDRLERATSDFGPLRDVSGLEAAIRKARKASSLDEDCERAGREAAEAERLAAAGLAGLWGWEGGIGALRALKVPPASTIDRHEAEVGRIEAECADVEAKLVAARDREARLRDELDARHEWRDLPTEAGLMESRGFRDHLWEDLVAGGITPGGDARSEEYRRSVVTVDDRADRLRRDAEQVGIRAERLRELERSGAEVSALEATFADTCARRDATSVAWQAVIAPLGLGGFTPTEHREWQSLRSEVLERFELARTRNEEHARLVDRIKALHDPIIAHLEALEEAGPDEQGGLAGSIERGEAVVNEAGRAAKLREKLESKLEQARAGLETAGDALSRSIAAESLWREEWDGWMLRLDLPPEASPARADACLRVIHELDDAMEKRREFEGRISGIERDAREFEQATAALAARLKRDMAEATAPVFLDALRAEMVAERIEATRRADARKRLDELETKLERARVEDVSAEEALAAYCEEAGCNEPSELKEAVARSAERSRCEQEAREAARQWSGLAAGYPEEPFRREVDESEPGRIAAEAAGMESRIAVLQQERNAESVRIGAARGELDRMDGNGRAADLAEEAQSSLATLGADVTRYATLKLALAVLNRGIERYRDRSQGPVLTRAGAVLRTLTGEAFERLRIDDDEGQPVLLGVRPDGTGLRVEQMSDGACDQLYLALRVASLEAWLEHHEPMPLVLDDILLNFDDARAAAALAVLSDLSRRTQVLFFTHHRHVVELARSTVPESVLFVQDL